MNKAYKQYFDLIFGSTLLTLGIYLFVTPNGINFGGVIGLAQIIEIFLRRFIAILWGDRIFEKCGIGRDEGETAGKPLKYAGNGDFRRGTEARIINNLEMRMRRRRSALFSRPRGRTTAAARRGAHIRRIRKSPGNARITAFLRLLDDMSRSAPSRKSQQQTKRTRASRLMLLL